MERRSLRSLQSTSRLATGLIAALALPGFALLVGTQPAGADTTQTFVITTTSIPPATWNQPYSFAMQATGAPGPYTWNEFGALPPGLSMSSAGVISGTPTQIGQSNFFVYVSTLGGGCSGLNTCAQGNFTISVSSGVAALDPTIYLLQSTFSGPALNNLVTEVACDVLNVVNTALTVALQGAHGPPGCSIPILGG